MNINNARKIIVVSQFWPPNFIGGGEISTYIICQELVKKGYEITVLTPNVPEQKDKYFKYIKLSNPPSFLEPFEEKYFSKISCKENLPGGIYWASDFYAAAFLSNKNVKKIVTVRDYWPICNCGDAVSKDNKFCYERDLKSVLNCNKIRKTGIFIKIPRIIKYLYNINFRKNILSKFDRVIFISNFIKDKVTFDIHLNNYSVIYNSLPQSYIEKKIANKKMSNNILFVGAVIKHKGPSVIINALRKIIEINSEITLTIVGEIYGEYIALLDKLKRLKNIRVTGKIPQNRIIEFYDTSDIVVNPSMWSEPFGRTIIEGMSRKCIPIATNQGGPAEIIKDKKIGFLFKKGDYEQLAKIIINLYQNPEIMKTIQEKARNFAIKNFSPNKIAQKYEKVINSF